MVQSFADNRKRKQIPARQDATGDHHADNDSSNDEYVYVAETGGVYHTNMNCTYITVRIVDKNDVSLAGKSYCRHCINHHASGRYVTVSGSRIHKDINCSSLKRTVHMVRKSELDGLPLCSKCMGGVRH